LNYFPQNCVVEWPGVRNAYMLPLDEDARAAVAAMEAKRRAQTGRTPKRPRSTNRVGLAPRGTVRCVIVGAVTLPAGGTR
jgi:hypothetical protein